MKNKELVSPGHIPIPVEKILIFIGVSSYNFFLFLTYPPRNLRSVKLARKEIEELVKLDALCFEPPINYSYRELEAYTSLPGAILLREYEGKNLIAYCLGDAGTGEIITLDVHPHRRGHGIGKRLLTRMLDELRARGVTQAISQVAIDNLPSLRLHQNLGFEIRYILYGYYPDGSAAFELVLPLKPSVE